MFQFILQIVFSRKRELGLPYALPSHTLIVMFVSALKFSLLPMGFVHTFLITLIIFYTQYKELKHDEHFNYQTLNHTIFIKKDLAIQKNSVGSKINIVLMF